MYIEDLEKEEQNRKSKKLEYELAKTRVKSHFGKRALTHLNKFHDYRPGMFNHLK